jgi:hypothetical protein
MTSHPHKTFTQQGDKSTTLAPMDTSQQKFLRHKNPNSRYMDLALLRSVKMWALYSNQDRLFFLPDRTSRKTLTLDSHLVRTTKH